MSLSTEVNLRHLSVKVGQEKLESYIDMSKDHQGINFKFNININSIIAKNPINDRGIVNVL